MFDWEDQNESLEQMAEVENFGFDSIVEKVSVCLGCNICTYYGLQVLNRRMEHKSP